jgi:Transglycosylase SLT domain/D-alanyl-D-alanine carboxypeptidase
MRPAASSPQLLGLRPNNSRFEPRTGHCRGQASVLLVGGLAGVLIGALVLAMVARGLAREGAAQRAADLSALAGARAMREAYPRLFEPASVDGRPNPLHLDRAAYLELGRVAARATAERNGAALGEIAFPDDASFAPVRIRVVVRERIEVERGGARRSVGARASATAELAPLGPGGLPAGGGYDGPLERRQGKPMRPDVARAFDRMERAARADGVTLLITSAYRSDAEQAVLWRRNPDPRWVARPGESLHRFGTELDLGPPAAYAWLAAHAGEFHFLKRYPHEPWHFGYTLNARSTPRATDGGAASGSAASGGAAGGDAAGPGDGRAGRALPSFVPAEFAPALARAAQRWNVSAALLAAQLYAESNFNPFATSPAGAQGIAQFMPETARAMGLADPFDAGQAIDAQARLMRDLLRRFAAVPLALAAYNAGPGPVEACGCVPPYPETRGYVARLLGLLGGMGELGAGRVVVRLVE